MRGFARHQRLGMAGAIEQQIGAEIFGDVVGDGIDAVDTTSATLLAKRVSGMVRGSMVSPCAFHSAAMASAISRVGATTWRPDGVRIGLPSSVMAKPPSASATPAAA